MLVGHRFWIDLLNAQDTWVTDGAMLSVIPEDAREFESQPQWSRHQALAYLHNNVTALRANYLRLESGQPLDVDLLNPVLNSVRLRFVDWRAREDRDAWERESRRRGDRLQHFGPVAITEGWNRGSAAIRHVVQRAYFHFARYADQRLADPAYPGATAGMARVLKCPGPECSVLVPCGFGEPLLCSRHA